MHIITSTQNRLARLLRTTRCENQNAPKKGSVRMICLVHEFKHMLEVFEALSEDRCLWKTTLVEATICFLSSTEHLPHAIKGVTLEHNPKKNQRTATRCEDYFFVNQKFINYKLSLIEQNILYHYYFQIML